MGSVFFCLISDRLLDSEENNISNAGSDYEIDGRVGMTFRLKYTQIRS